MVVILQKCVVSFITVLYNLCKTYLGNNPYKIEPAEGGFLDFFQNIPSYLSMIRNIIVPTYGI